jgi:hypothetical protein
MPNMIKQLAQSAISVFGVRTEDEPPYAVIDRIGDIEVREYSKRGAAETTVLTEDAAQARSEAFGILAGYIFGKNKDRRELAMTAPVSTKQSQELAMTAPVEARSSPSGGLTMRFFLPRDVTVESAPLPDDGRVKLVEVPSEKLAVLRFSGGWSDDLIAARMGELTTTLQASRWTQSGKPLAFFYDPPFALPFLRRNEVAVRVEGR